MQWSKGGFPFLFDEKDHLCRLLRLNLSAVQSNEAVLSEWLSSMFAEPTLGASLVASLLSAGLTHMAITQRLSTTQWNAIEKLLSLARRKRELHATAISSATISPKSGVSHVNSPLTEQSAMAEASTTESDDSSFLPLSESSSAPATASLSVATGSSLVHRLPMPLLFKVVGYLEYSAQLRCARVCRDLWLTTRDMRCPTSLLDGTLFCAVLMHNMKKLRRDSSTDSGTATVGSYNPLRSRTNLLRLKVSTRSARVKSWVETVLAKAGHCEDESRSDAAEDDESSDGMFQRHYFFHPFAGVVLCRQALYGVRQLDISGVYGPCILPLKWCASLECLRLEHVPFCTLVYALFEMPVKSKRRMRCLTVSNLTQALFSEPSLYWMPEEGISAELLLFLELLLPHASVRQFCRRFALNVPRVDDHIFTMTETAFRHDIRRALVSWAKAGNDDDKDTDEDDDDYGVSDALQPLRVVGSAAAAALGGASGRNEDSDEKAVIADVRLSDGALISAAEAKEESSEKYLYLCDTVLKSHWSRLESLKVFDLEFGNADWTDIGTSQCLFHILSVFRDLDRVKHAFPKLKHLMVSHTAAATTEMPDFSFLFADLCLSILQTTFLHSFHIHRCNFDFLMRSDVQTIVDSQWRQLEHLCLGVPLECSSRHIDSVLVADDLDSDCSYRESIEVDSVEERCNACAFSRVLQRVSVERCLPQFRRLTLNVPQNGRDADHMRGALALFARSYVSRFKSTSVLAMSSRRQHELDIVGHAEDSRFIIDLALDTLLKTPRHSLHRSSVALADCGLSTLPMLVLKFHVVLSSFWRANCKSLFDNLLRFFEIGKMVHVPFAVHICADCTNLTRRDADTRLTPMFCAFVRKLHSRVKSCCYKREESNHLCLTFGHCAKCLNRVDNTLRSCDDSDRCPVCACF